MSFNLDIVINRFLLKYREQRINELTTKNGGKWLNNRAHGNLESNVCGVVNVLICVSW